MKGQRNNLWWLFCLAALVGGLVILPGRVGGGALAQLPTPTLPPAVWMTPVGGEEMPGVAKPDYLLLGGIALVLLLLGGAVLLGIVALLARRRKAQRRAAAPSTFHGYVIVVQAGPGAGARYPITQGTLVMGRGADCQVVVNYPNVSLRHAQLDWDGQQFIVQDLGSTNGTFINGHRISGPVLFRVGDVLSLGGTVELALRAGG